MKFYNETWILAWKKTAEVIVALDFTSKDKTPRRKRSFCHTHDRPASVDCGVRIFKKHCIAKDPQDLLRSKPARMVPLTWPLHDWIRAQIHIQSKPIRTNETTEDLDIAEARDFVTCNTAKMSKRARRRSGGWLVACNETGGVLAFQEFFGGESLTQRAAFVNTLVQTYDSISTICHDDACHLRRFMDRWCSSIPRLCFPHTHYILDRFHARAHSDRWCQEHCSPNTKTNQPRLAKVNSSACEILFAWFSGFKKSFRHMSRLTGHFFVSEILLLRNDWHCNQTTRRTETD